MRMPRVVVSATLLLSVLSCRTVKNGTCPTRSYVWVGKHLQREWPHIVDVRNGPKRLVFVGCDHNRDTMHRQFALIEAYFARLKPQVAFNEGGQITKHYVSRNAGIQDFGESGCLKFLSDKAGIQTLNGDLSDSLEFAEMICRYPKDKLFLYYVMERLVIPYLSGFYGNEPFETVYPREVRDYFAKNGFPLAEDERSVAYFQELFQRYVGHSFKPELNADIELFDYVNGGTCEFCAIGRASKMVRDSVLLAKLDHALNEHDRVIVTFGGGHALALEPALKQIVNKKR